MNNIGIQIWNYILIQVIYCNEKDFEILNCVYFFLRLFFEYIFGKQKYLYGFRIVREQRGKEKKYLI